MVVNHPPSVLTILTGVALLCGFAIALVYEATAERIASNRVELLEEAVARVWSGAIRLQGYELADELAPASVDQASFVVGYDSAGRFIGVAVPAAIMGYQDTISMLFGYDPEQQRLTGFAVLQSRETPGLGSKIGTDPAFLASLSSLDVTLEDAKLETRVVLAGRSAERRPHEVDGITGATVSSNAVVQAINAMAPRLTMVRNGLEVLQESSVEVGGAG